MMKSIALFLLIWKAFGLKASLPLTLIMPIILLWLTPPSINLAKFFLFVMLRSHAKAASNDHVRGAVDNQQYADVGCSRYL